MDEESVLESPAVNGLEEGNVANKLHRRKHMAGGPRMVRQLSRNVAARKNMHPPERSRGITRGTRTAVALPGMSLLGECALKGARRGKVIPGDHRAEFRG